jgi:tRNA threonylcarbamoyladenosine biosynthesis protein TsaB
MAAHARDESARAGDPETARRLVAVAIDAKKDELYVAVYDGEDVRLQPSHLPIAEAAARVAEATAGEPFVSIADVAAFTDFAVPAAGGPAPSLVRRLTAPPSAGWVARIAVGRLARRREDERGAPQGEGAPPRDSAHSPGDAGLQASMDPAEVVPLYVRAPDAVPANSGTAGPFAMLPSR